MKNWLKKSILTLAIASFSLSFAVDKTVNEKSYKKENTVKAKNYDQGHAVEEHQMLGAYNAPARIDVRGSFDVFTEAAFIYWQGKEKGLDFAFSDKTLATAKDHWVYPHFKYKPGFKVGLGVNFDYDNWDMFVGYTWLHFIDKKTSYEGNDETFTATWYEGLSISKVANKWTFDYDLIHLALERAFYLGTKFTCKPSFGLKGGWITQKFNPVYTTPNGDIFVKAKSRSWLVGPRAALDANYLFGMGFKGFGKVGTALFFQRGKTYVKKENSENTETLSYNYYDKDSIVVPNANLSLGLGWGTYFANNGFHFNFDASYDFEIYWNQNLMRQMLDKGYATVQTKANDLTLQGLTLTMRFDF